MPDELLKRLTALDFDDFGSLHVNSIERRESDLIIRLDVHADEEADIPSNVVVTCYTFRESNLAPGHYTELEFSQDHVLLWHYNQPYALLSFYGKTDNPLAIVGALFEAHTALVGSWIPFQKYLNTGLGLSTLIEGSHGLLADGPEPLIIAYEEVMHKHGISASYHESSRPLDEMYSVLIFDQAFVIGERFEIDAL